jgi:hypothetical protein
MRHAKKSMLIINHCARPGSVALRRAGMQISGIPCA